MIVFDIFTLFPEMFFSPLHSSLLKKAFDKNIIEVRLHNIRDYAEGKHRVTDDTPYGGGGGMVMKVEPVAKALDAVISDRSATLVVLLSPQGEVFTQTKAEEFAGLHHIALVCGHYEGIDERIRHYLVDREISIGDYVLTGGELPAMILVDAVARLIPGFTGNAESVRNDSHTTGLLEGPHYTKPRVYNGWEVPDVLISGHEKRIREWRRRESLRRTLERRPELLSRIDLTEEDDHILAALKGERGE